MYGMYVHRCSLFYPAQGVTCLVHTRVCAFARVYTCVRACEYAVYDFCLESDKFDFSQVSCLVIGITAWNYEVGFVLP